MPLTRVYLPLTAEDLDDLCAGRDLGPLPLAAHGVTPALGRPGLTTDEEELEHEAWVAATEEASARAAGALRVVAAADVDSGVVTVPDRPDVPSRVEVGAPLARTRIVSLHVDETAGDTGTADLLWFDVTELDVVRSLLSG